MLEKELNLLDFLSDFPSESSIPFHTVRALWQTDERGDTVDGSLWTAAACKQRLRGSSPRGCVAGFKQIS